MDHRKHYRSNFKAKVAIRALRKDLTEEQVAEEYNISLENVRKWRETLEIGAEHLFHDASSKSRHHHQLGRFWRHRKKYYKKTLIIILRFSVAAFIVYYAINEAMRTPPPPV